MAHNITVRKDGKAEAAYAITPAWHGLGTVLDHPMSSAEALRFANLDWQVLQEPVCRTGGSFFAIASTIPGYRLNLRSDNDLSLGIVSEQYRVVQNREAFSFMDELIENHEMTYEAAFSLCGGKKVVLLGRLPVVDDLSSQDTLLRYILFTTSHDGSSAVRFGPTSVRTVCQNTLQLALGKGGIESFAISHQGNIRERLTKAREILAHANQQFTLHASLCRKLASYTFARDTWMEYLNLMCPVLDERDPDYSPQRLKALAETRNNIALAYSTGALQQIGGMRHTAWAAYCAVSEHIDHLPRRGASSRSRSEARFNVTLYGTGHNMKRRAFEAACRFAGISQAS
jgi:phage/plasmid-like protein (TIGR03299 family)